MRRREFITLLGGAAVARPLAARAQPPGKTYRIGFLGAEYRRLVDAVRTGLRRLGYEEGKNIIIHYRWAEGRYDRLPELAAELVKLNVDVIVTHSTPGARAAKQATSSIPIVVAAVADPVDVGLVASLVRPGGNLTGLTFFPAEHGAKRLELIKEAIPTLTQVTVLINPANPSHQIVLGAMQRTASALGVELVLIEVKADDIAAAIATVAMRRAPALVVIEDPLLISNATQIAELALQNGLPMVGFKPQAEAGALLEYGVDVADLFSRSASFVDKGHSAGRPADRAGCQIRSHRQPQDRQDARHRAADLDPAARRRGDRVRRREFITLLGVAAAWPLAARAQTGRVYRVGILAATPLTAAAHLVNSFRNGMQERGYIEGQNLTIDFRSPSVSFEQNPDVAAELVQSGIDVIVAWTTPAVIAARRATSAVPIVIVGVADPVGLGLVASLARPGANITGVSNVSSDLGGKIIELLREIAPHIRRVGVVRNTYNPGAEVQLRETEHALWMLGLQFEVAAGRTPEEFENAFARLSANGANGVVLLPDPSLIQHAGTIAELAQRAGLPTVFQRRENVDAGGLLSYGPSLSDQFYQVAGYVDRILKGAKPAQLPVEQPTKFELVINHKTAKALGLEVPPTLLARADEVIE